ncbi:MAG: hypothetical protein ACI97N_002288 [Cognaticolwellia sp.]|jgi:hypothetical protein
MEKVAHKESVNLAKRLQGKFIDKDCQDVVVLREGDVQIDQIGFNLTLTSKIVWVNDTQYNLILEEVSGETADAGVKVGDVMNVKVAEVTDEYYIADCEFNGQRVITKLWFS